MEKEFIRLLITQGYEYLAIHNEAALVENLRAQLELLNYYHFTDSEWERFFGEIIANANDGIVEKTRRIQTDPVQNLHRDDGSTKNITLSTKRTSATTACRSSTNTRWGLIPARSTIIAMMSPSWSTACPSSMWN